MLTPLLDPAGETQLLPPGDMLVGVSLGVRDMPSRAPPDDPAPRLGSELCLLNLERVGGRSRRSKLGSTLEVAIPLLQSRWRGGGVGGGCTLWV